MEITNVPINELKPAEYNPRQATKEQVKQLRESITKFGLVDPVIVNKNAERFNIIIGGHFRWRVAKDMGLSEIPVFYIDLSEKEEKELNLRLNKNLGSWDWDMLANFESDFLKDVGFDDQEMLTHGFGVGVEEDGLKVEDELKDIDQAKSKTGEIYELGQHRIMIGDSTDSKQVGLLMDGLKAKLIFTDPPYNVDYNYDKYTDGKKMKWDRIFNDNKKPDDFIAFIGDCFQNMYDYSTDDASYYCCFAINNYEQFRKGIEVAGWRYSQVIIWLKERFILAMGQDFHRIYENIMYGWKDSKKRYFRRHINNLSDFWNVEKIDFMEELDLWFEKRDQIADYEHPTQKPIRLAERALVKSSEKGDIVLDLFLGSGSTLIACDQLERRCFGMELDPKYADVIIKRWEDRTGQKAILFNG